MFRILVVCTANICRSPSAAALLSHHLRDLIATGDLSIESAGVAAYEGLAQCPISAAQTAARSGQPVAAHSSRRVAAAMLDGSDLILALDRSHRAELARLAPASRPRTFTLRHAARLSAQVEGYMATGQLPPGAPALPDTTEGQLRWWVAELDAARGTPVAVPEPEPPEPWHSDDVPDPHEIGAEFHATAAELTEDAILTLCSGVSRIVANATHSSTCDSP